MSEFSNEVASGRSKSNEARCGAKSLALEAVLLPDFDFESHLAVARVLSPNGVN